MAASKLDPIISSYYKEHRKEYAHFILTGKAD